jgi:AraC-like DNA-binding protein
MEYGFESPAAEHGDYRPFVHGAVDVPFHWHDRVEILMVLRGSARITVDRQDCLLSVNDLMIVNAHSPHSSVCCSPDAVICGVHIDAYQMEKRGLEGLSRRRFQCKSFLHGKEYNKRIVDPMRSLIARIILCFGAPEDRLLQQSLVGLLCCHLYRHVEWEEAAPEHAGHEESRHRISRIMQTIRSDPTTSFTLEQFAESEALTIPHLSRLFRKEVGIGFREYSQNVRLDRAVMRLKSSRESISDIAVDEGFSSGALFYAKFRERFGCSPAEYRKRLSLTAETLSDTGLFEPLLAPLADESHFASSDLTRLPNDRARMRISALHASAC